MTVAQCEQAMTSARPVGRKRAYAMTRLRRVLSRADATLEEVTARHPGVISLPAYEYLRPDNAVALAEGVEEGDSSRQVPQPACATSGG